MANYAFVENNTPVEFHDLLPRSWRNVSGLNLLEGDEPALNQLGWYRVTKNTTDYDPDRERVTGYTYVFENNKLYENPVIEQFTPEPQVIPVPDSITATQIRLWLVRNNFPMQGVLDAINGIQDEMVRSELLVRWEYAPYFDRNNPFINIVGSALGLSAEQIDQAFIDAAGYD